MSTLIKQYKGVIRFLLTFLGTYIVLSLCYNYYLSTSEGGAYFPDYITHKVARASEKVVCKMGFPVDSEPHETIEGIKLLVNKRYVSVVVEGCNGISVMILFLAFVFSFYQGIKKTLIFSIVGVLIIHVSNIFRIAVITVLYYRFPQYQEVLHQLIFPGLIYGMVFILWMYWVKQFKIKTMANA